MGTTPAQLAAGYSDAWEARRGAGALAGWIRVEPSATQCPRVTLGPRGMPARSS